MMSGSRQHENQEAPSPIAGALLAVLTALIAVAGISIGASHFNQTSINEQDVRLLIQDGDIIVRRGLDTEADIAASVDGQWSHIGIAEVSNSEAWVIHAAAAESNYGGQVLREPLSDFIKRSKKVGIYRPDDLAIAKRLSTAAYRYIGLPFDNDYSMQSSEKIYCSELVLRVLSDINHPASIKSIRWSLPLLGSIDAIMPSSVANNTGKLIATWPQK